ncbi:MAG: ribokinase [Rubripirellula sp.]
MPKICVIGSINMDLVIRCRQLPIPGETVIANSSAEIPGGKGANQAVGAARAGGTVTMVGRVGDDAFAHQLLQNLKNENISTNTIASTEQCASGIAIVAVEQRGENERRMVPGANGRISQQDIHDAKTLIFDSDIVLLQLEIPFDAVAEAMQIAKAAGLPIILDPAPMPTSLPDNLLSVDFLCPNQSEASALSGLPVETVADAKACVPILHQKGAKNVLITLGRDGAVVSDGTTIEWIEPIKIKPVDTTAAGDAFAGALAVRLANKHSLIESARFACAAGSIAATRLGAQPAMPTAEEINAMLN